MSDSVRGMKRQAIDRKCLQSMYLIKDLCLEYEKNPQKTQQKKTIKKGQKI